MNLDINERIQASTLSAVDKLAIRTAIASLELLKQAAQELGMTVEQIDPESLMQWIQEKAVQ